MEVAIESTRKSVLDSEFQNPYFSQIKTALVQEYEQGYTIFPRGNLIFNAFNMTPFDLVKVVILGQDPYHGQ